MASPSCFGGLPRDVVCGEVLSGNTVTGNSQPQYYQIGSFSSHWGTCSCKHLTRGIRAGAKIRPLANFVGHLAVSGVKLMTLRRCNIIQTTTPCTVVAESGLKDSTSNLKQHNFCHNNRFCRRGKYSTLLSPLYFNLNAMDLTICFLIFLSVQIYSVSLADRIIPFLATKICTERMGMSSPS